MPLWAAYLILAVLGAGYAYFSWSGTKPDPDNRTDEDGDPLK